MNIQAKKLELIEEFLRISDESLILKLEAFLKKRKEKLHVQKYQTYDNQ